MLLLLLLNHFSRVRLCATPQRAAHQAPHPWDSPGKNTGVGCHFLLQCMKVKNESEVTQSCPTLSDPMDCSLPGSSAHGIFQARVLEWGAMAFSLQALQSVLFCYSGSNTPGHASASQNITKHLRRMALKNKYQEVFQKQKHLTLSSSGRKRKTIDSC